MTPERQQRNLQTRLGFDQVPELPLHDAQEEGGKDEVPIGPRGAFEGLGREDVVAEAGLDDAGVEAAEGSRFLCRGGDREGEVLEGLDCGGPFEVVVEERGVLPEIDVCA